VSIEREVWPRLVGEGLFGIADREAYWLDIGTPERYLQATADILSGRARTSVAQALDAEGLSVAPGAQVDGELVGPAMVGEGAVIAPGATVGPGSVIGPGAQVGPGARVVRSVVLDDARVGEGALLEDAILAPEAQVGAGSEVTELSVVGPRARVGAENRLRHGVRLFPGAELGDRAVAF
jgi:mannose-1-phosphate guanylyltransferase